MKNKVLKALHKFSLNCNNPGYYNCVSYIPQLLPVVVPAISEGARGMYSQTSKETSLQ